MSRRDLQINVPRQKISTGAQSKSEIAHECKLITGRTVKWFDIRSYCGLYDRNRLTIMHKRVYGWWTKGYKKSTTLSNKMVHKRTLLVRVVRHSIR